MLQIDNHEEKALEVIVPYLHQFPEIIGLGKNSGKRTQDIENIAWELLWDLDIDSAEGIWLDYLGTKVGQNRTYHPAISGAFTFGGTSDEGFGAGKFLSSALTGSSTKIARSDLNFRRAIRAKIIQNNTDCSLDELKNACKLLYNAQLVLINEDYPAGISSIYMYGSNLVETSDANSEIKKMLPGGVSLTHVYFIIAYNLFKNNAFISYESNYLIPPSNNFEVNLSFTPNNINTNTKYLLSEASSFSSQPIGYIGYNSVDGAIFAASPSYYVDGNGLPYIDGNGDYYYSDEGDLYLSGGTINLNEENKIKIVKSGTSYSLYVNDILADSEISNTNIGGDSNYNLYLGVSNNSYYNAGSIYNLNIIDTTTSTTILNDNLKNNTAYGTNNGVIFL